MKKLTDFAKATLEDRYLLDSETPDDMFKRVAKAYRSSVAHGKRMLNYMRQGWFLPSTPILSNGGTEKGLPISCQLNKVNDSLEGIDSIWSENMHIASKGSGIGTDWSSVRSVGEPVSDKGVSSGVIPFMKVTDAKTVAVNQGGARRGSSALFLNVSHPEIIEFIGIRKPSGDMNRQCLNIHHGVTLSDDFMRAVETGRDWELKSPVDDKTLKIESARAIFEFLLETRAMTGEPYLIFEGNANKSLPSHHKKLGLKITQSNLCSEIFLPTGEDHLGKNRTAVCCLGSVNAETYDEWKDEPLFIKDCLRFLDNVITDFIKQTRHKIGFANSRYSAKRERSVGLGLMGLHSYFQKNNIAFESFQAKMINKGIFAKIRNDADAANVELAEELGSCPDAIDAGESRRFSYMLAVAPTASISIIAGSVSPCIEPYSANIFTQKTLSGSFEVRNPHLTDLLNTLHKNTKEVWSSIIAHEGSVQQLDFLTPEQKNIYKTAFEIDQRWVVELAADRAPFIDQGQSINLFLNGDVDKKDLLMLHFTAWKKGIKSLYYLRSKAISRAGSVGGVEKDNTIKAKEVFIKNDTDYEECLSCQ